MIQWFFVFLVFFYSINTFYAKPVIQLDVPMADQHISSSVFQFKGRLLNAKVLFLNEKKVVVRLDGSFVISERLVNPYQWHLYTSLQLLSSTSGYHMLRHPF